MSAPATTTVPQLALQSYLDSLLQDASLELAASVSLDEFEAAVREEQARDASTAPQPLLTLAPEMPPEVESANELPEAVAPMALLELPEALEPAPPAPIVEPIVDLYKPSSAATFEPALAEDGRPQWAQEPFECLLFDVAGLTLAVPLVCLGSIYPLEGHDLTPLFGQPDWFLGILPCQAGNLKVLDTARWVMPDRYRDDFRQGLQFVISVQGYEWGLAVHQVSRSIRLDPNEIKWRSQRSQRPWLAGTVIEHMCALLDVSALAELITSGAAKRLVNGQVH
ncbi:CheW domain-containing protein [Pseudomonas segetis]|uniref:Purine-binding chemotaxis protein CheW n=1 Tax=Pseudomonas segetis TaxID=298908 RepID=A0A239JX95_9PSED|nr:CheW domain-containing protein [Pseudomonas segetis]SNT10043.1 purine-binding chemotaxis protein CheW [Pseudomonas segetis]